MRNLDCARPEPMVVDQAEFGEPDQFPSAQGSTDASEDIDQIDSATIPQATLGQRSTDAAIVIQPKLALGSIDVNEGIDQLNSSTVLQEFDAGDEVGEEDSDQFNETFRISSLNFSTLNTEMEECSRSHDPEEAHSETPDDNEQDAIDREISSLDYVNALSELRNMPSIVDLDAAEYEEEFQLIRQKTQKALDSAFSQKRVTLRQLIETDDDMVAFTGMRFDLFKELVEILKDCEEPTKTAEFSLSPEDRVLLCLVKLKINLSFKCLRALFGVTRQTCTNTFVYILYFLEYSLSHVICWPTDEEHIKNLPACFHSFRHVRVVLDCTEVSVEKPKCLNCRLKLYSFYKGCETVKFLFGVAPSGLINFVSDAYGGRASDKAIFTDSNLFDFLVPTRDQVMVDKGFDIDVECAINQIQLVIPPFRTKGRQFRANEVHSTKNIAAARVHIERKIQRVKIYSILKQKISWKLIPYIDKIAKAIAILSNLQNPILSDQRFRK